MEISETQRAEYAEGRVRALLLELDKKDAALRRAKAEVWMEAAQKYALWIGDDSDCAADPQLDEVKVERVHGGYIVTYFDDNGRYIREVHATRMKVVCAVASILAMMDGKHSKL